MDSGAVSHCRAGKHCTAATTEGAAVTSKADTICSSCVYDIQRRLAELPHLAAALRIFLGGSMKVAYTSKVQATREPAAPMNVAVADLIDEIGDVIDRAGGLSVHIRTLIQRPAELFIIWIRNAQQKTYLDGVDRALAIRHIHHRASDAVGLHEVWESRHAPCPHCDQRSLGNWIGSGRIECTNEDCGISMTLDVYERWCEIKARE